VAAGRGRGINFGWRWRVMNIEDVAFHNPADKGLLEESETSANAPLLTVKAPSAKANVFSFVHHNLSITKWTV